MSQANSNLSFLDTFNKISDMASEELGKAQKYSSNAQTGGAIAGLATQGAGTDWSKLKIDTGTFKGF